MAGLNTYIVDLVNEIDPEIAMLIDKETKKQNNTLDLIASENKADKYVCAPLASAFTNKYSEGYFKKRYYPGNQFVDEVENIAIKRAKKVFRLNDEWGVNVQPHSGSPANLEVYLAVLNPGDVALGMKLKSGGHLSHGHDINSTGQLWKFFQYGVDDKGFLDYDEVARLAKENNPKLIVAGYSAYSRDLKYKKFREIADDAGALLMVDMAHIAGLVAAEVLSDPFEYADIVTTTTHKTLRGPRGGVIFSKGEELSKKVNRSVFPGIQGGPHDNQTAALAVCLEEASTPEFKEYAQQIVKNSRRLCKQMIDSGYKVLTNGTDNHLFVMDFRGNDFTGVDVENALAESGIYVSRSTVPNDPQPPMKTSGIRFGTPTVTTRGMKETEMDELSELICRVLADPDSNDVKREVRSEVLDLCKRFPVD